MSSKRNRYAKRDEEGDTLRETDKKIYSSGIMDQIEQASAGYIAVEPVDIFAIVPDRSQPRRVLPSVIRAQWNGNPETLSDIFDYWIQLIGGERGSNFDLGSFMNAGTDIRDDEYECGPFETVLLGLIQLASSIHRQGLTNPITVVPDGELYQLETGERRWFAYHLLNFWYGGNDWLRIPAREVPQHDIWRQATENTARNDLNAIGKARQLAILIMELIGRDNFKPYHEAVSADGSDREFYAQVSDGNKWRIPRGKGEDLLQATGLSSTQMIREYRALLRLPDEVWQIADDFNWSHGVVKGLVQESRGDNSTLIELANVAAGYTVEISTVDKGENARKLRRPVWQQGDSILTGPASRALRNITKMRQGAYNVDDSVRQKLLEDIDLAIRNLALLKESLK